MELNIEVLRSWPVLMHLSYRFVPLILFALLP